MKARYLALVLVLLGADTPPSGGTISGSVITVEKGKAIARDHVFVYLERMRPRRPSEPHPGEGMKSKILQIKRNFQPRVVVVPVGASVAFPNLDKEEHNVFSPTSPGFDLGRYKFDKQGRVQPFERAAEFDIFCDKHPQMGAKVKVVESPYIAQVEDGRFTFTNIPPGKYKVVAWTPNSPETRTAQAIQVTAGGSLTIDRPLQVQVKRRSGCHPNKDGMPYPGPYTGCPEDY